MFPRLYSDEPCPLDGYQGYTFRVLLNPTGQEKTDWIEGNLGIDGCADCATARAAESPSPFCPSCQTARGRFGRATCAIYGTSRTEGFDFSTLEASLASFEQDGLPDELLRWLYMLPAALWVQRNEEIKKKLPTSSTTGNSTPGG